MKFSNLTLGDIDDENLEIQNAANPANFANVDVTPCSENDIGESEFANLLLISANPLLIDSVAEQPATEISSSLANFSKRLATGNPTESNTLAGLAALAGFQESENTLSSSGPIAGIAKIAGSENPQNAISPQHDTALAILQKLHTEHRQRLIDGGHSPRSAMVHRHDYWKALRQAGIPPDEVAFDLAEAGQVRVLADGLYWIPVEAQP